MAMGAWFARVVLVVEEVLTVVVLEVVVVDGLVVDVVVEVVVLVVVVFLRPLPPGAAVAGAARRLARASVKRVSADRGRSVP